MPETCSRTVMINGQAREMDGLAPHATALDALRTAGWLGAKEGCAEGECGACAVLVARPGVAAATEWTAVNSCLMPAAALADQEVRTAEGLSEGLHPVQRELAGRGGSQCGYCTAGFVCSMAGEYYRPDRENEFDLHALSGNLCRCTGYRPIRDAAQVLEAPEEDDPLAARCTQDPPKIKGFQSSSFIRPVSLQHALGVLAAQPDATVVAGGTDVSVGINLKAVRPSLLVSVAHLEELRALTVREDSVEIGAALTLSEVERRLNGMIPLLSQMIPQFASRLIRNSATFGGSLGNASPIGDLAPALLALNARLVLTSSAGEREVTVADFFTGYRRTILRRGELISRIKIPRPVASYTAFHKISKRRFDDIASVSVALAFEIEDGVVTSARIGLGGVAATPIRAHATEVTLLRRPWTDVAVEAGAIVLSSEGTPMDDHRAGSAYRAAMLGESLRRFAAEVVSSR